jgi:hypothetical protein
LASALAFASAAAFAWAAALQMPTGKFQIQLTYFYLWDYTSIFPATSVFS